MDILSTGRHTDTGSIPVRSTKEKPYNIGVMRLFIFSLVKFWSKSRANYKQIIPLTISIDLIELVNGMVNGNELKIKLEAS